MEKEQKTFGQKFKEFTTGSKFKILLSYLVVIFILLVFAVLTEGRSISFKNIKLVVKQSVTLMIATTGALFVISHGNIDFSIGGIVGLSATLGCMAGNINPWLALPVMIITAVVCEVIVGIIHVGLNVPSFVASFAMMFLGQGITSVLNSISYNQTPKALEKFDTEGFYYLILLLVFVAAYIVFEYTKIGKYNKAIGANALTAKMSGIPVAKYKLIAYAVSGVAIGFASFTTMLRGGGTNSSTGGTLANNILISVVLAGMSLSGGIHTRLSGALVGAFVFTMLTNSLTMLGFDTSMVNAIKGIIFLVMVGIVYNRNSSTINS